jgi:alkylated DNA repair dioxygenase AlkB
METTTKNIKRNLNLPQAEVSIYDNFFSDKESLRLFSELSENVNWKQEYIKIYGREIPVPRLQAWYGDAGYSYSGINLDVNDWNEQLLEIKNKIEKETGYDFNSCLINLYRSGNDSVSWHQDNEIELGDDPIISSVSFGETRNFHLKSLDNEYKENIPLTNGSLLLMGNGTQNNYKHQVPKTKKNIQPRMNLTFRKVFP